MNNDLGFEVLANWVGRLQEKIAHLQRIMKNFILDAVSVYWHLTILINNSYLHSIKWTIMARNTLKFKLQMFNKKYNCGGPQSQRGYQSNEKFYHYQDSKNQLNS